MKSLKLKEYAPLALGVVLVAISYLLYANFSKLDSNEASAEFEQVIGEKVKEQEKLIDRFNIAHIKKGKFQLLHKEYQNLYDEEGITVCAYSQGRLIYWSDHHTPIPLDLSELDLDDHVIRLENGWYLASNETKRGYTICVLSLIKTEYLYENKYLESEFHSTYNFPHQATITADQKVSGITVEFDGDYLFTVVLDDKNSAPVYSGVLLPVMFVLGFILIFVFLFRRARTLLEDDRLLFGVLLFLVPLLILRIWIYIDGVPNILAEREFFNPELYAQSEYLPSLGALTLNVVLMFTVVYFLYRVIKITTTESKYHPVIQTLILLAGFFLLYSSSIIVNDLLKGLVINSQINFEITNLFDLNAFSFLGIINIGLILFSFFILTSLFITFVRIKGVHLNVYYFSLTLVSLFHIILVMSTKDYDILETLWPVAIIIITGLISSRSDKSFTFAPVVGLLIINALIAAHVVLSYSAEKEMMDRRVYAQYKLSNDEDPVTEILFSEMEAKLRTSDILAMPFTKPEEFEKAEFDHLLETRFFNKHWDQYEITYNLFDKDSIPVGLNMSTPKDFEELSDIITRSGIPSVHSPNIYHIPNYDSKLNYVANIVIPGENAEPYGFLFLELKSKKLPKDIGFPELLIDKNTKTIEALAGYSFARYYNGAAINALGKYNYSTNSERVEQLLGKNKEVVYNENAYNHLAYRISDSGIIIIGKPITTFLEQATSFSYLFALFSLLLLASIVVKEIDRISDLRRLTLKSKIQFVIIGLILVCLVLFGLGTRYFIERQYDEKNNQLISEKIRSVNVEVKKKLKGEQFYNTIRPDSYNYINSIMHKFSLVFFTDINFYDTNGDLIASSRHELFNAGLLSRKIHPKAYIELALHDRSEYIQNEQVGNMSYLSAYVPYINEKGKVLGYLNLPYFAKQNPLENELSDFLVAIINIFVLLFALSIVAALFVSNWVTKPLRLLQTSVSHIELGKANKPIAYTGQDEIGDLVQEYNKKVAELERAAGQLARTERESAWRDMAKQVAHEIKNPLTPMKLSVQHFHRSFDKDAPDASERIERFAETLIEQIENLTAIANEFSTFAKMPLAQIEDVDLVSLLSHTVQLFNEGDESEIEFEDLSTGDYIVKYDKDHLLRVFNNLIKNAMQAIPHERDGKITVRIKDKDDKYLVEVEDNGVGIPSDQVDKIFVPNFTTKSKGMGLGLSMVKSIINNAKGEVWFESEEGVGTTFFVELPRVSSDQ